MIQPTHALLAPPELIEILLSLGDDEVQLRQVLSTQLPHFDDNQIASLVDELKNRVVGSMRKDTGYALRLANLILLVGELEANPTHRAVGLRAKAQALAIGRGAYHEAMVLYDEALAICRAQGDVVGEARIQVTRIWALASLGRYEEAFVAGQVAVGVLEAHGEWRSLATLTMNLGITHGRQGTYDQALVMFDRAREAYGRLGPAGERLWHHAEANRAIALRHLGDYQAAIEACETVLAWGEKQSATGQLALTRQILAMIYFSLGRYNEALDLLEVVRQVFLTEQVQHGAVSVELVRIECLIQIGRLQNVVERCQWTQDLAQELAMGQEWAMAIRLEAIAYASLRQYDQAEGLFSQARAYFAEEQNEVLVAATDLEIAIVLWHQGEMEKSYAVAEQSMFIFVEHGLLMRGAQAQLVMARSAMALARPGITQQLLNHVLLTSKKKDLLSLSYQAHYQLGQLAVQQGQFKQAIQAFDQAIDDLERLRGNLMIEYRPDFLQDKQVVYEDIVQTFVALGEAHEGLAYAERAKSTALLDLLAYRMDMGLQARSESDQPLVDELMQLREDRDRLYRHWEVLKEQQREPESALQAVVNAENQITTLWHSLLIRNADYARDAALWQVRTEPIQPYLDSDMVLLEYFTVQDKVFVFVVTADAMTVLKLETTVTQIQQFSRFFLLNLGSVPKSNPAGLPSLIRNAQQHLQRFYKALIAPIADQIAAYQELIIVPHGPLHYLPFHAFHDGDVYLIEKMATSYLPSGSSLRYCRDVQPSTKGLVAFGHSHNGHLPYTVDEAKTIGTRWQGEVFVNDEATVQKLKSETLNCRVLHLATHGEFRPDNPLFSGLALHDGWITTLDIFNLQLQTSLVTLSACQTGRNVVGGGDELLGLMRAFFAAGTASLVLSHWPVEDHSTATLMMYFYENLANGQTKAQALQSAQIALLREPTKLSHPYFWASFFLVGDSRQL